MSASGRATLAVGGKQECRGGGLAFSGGPEHKGRGDWSHSRAAAAAEEEEEDHRVKGRGERTIPHECHSREQWNNADNDFISSLGDSIKRRNSVLLQSQEQKENIPDMRYIPRLGAREVSLPPFPASLCCVADVGRVKEKHTFDRVSPQVSQSVSRSPSRNSTSFASHVVRRFPPSSDLLCGRTTHASYLYIAFIIL